MKIKISMGEYGGVEFDEKEGFNIITKPQPLSNENGLYVSGKVNNVRQMRGLSHMQLFLDNILFEPLYVRPVQAGTRGDLYDVSFLVNDKFYLHTLMESDGTLYVSLLMTTLNGETDIIKFTYEGRNLELFFEEVKKDIRNIFDK